jgi:RNA polymerase sigma-70 factor (ECF subfamily)
MRQEHTGLAHGAGARLDGRVLEDSDETLMFRTGTGDRDAFRQLIERHLGRMVAFAGRILGDHAGAEDVAQETFLRLWTHASRWQPTARLSTWLHRVALNLCLDRLGRARDVALDDIAEPRDPGPSLIARMQARDIGRHVNAALAELPAQQRVAITLCHYQGLRNAEAADVMGVSVEAIESLLARGRRTLRTRLRDLLPDLLGEDDRHADG